MIYSLKAEKTYFRLNLDIELEKDKRVYCFIGENGAGKTKLLETLCSSLIFGHEILQTNTKNFSILKNSFISEDLKKSRLCLPIEVKINNEKIRNGEWNFTPLGVSSSINKNKYSSPLKYISAKNRGYGLNVDINKIKLLGNKVDRFSKNFMGTINSLNNKENETISIADWFVSRIIGNVGLIVDGKNSYNELIFLCKIIQELDPENFKNLIVENKNEKILSVYINEGKLYFNNIPFEHLPTGYMGIIKIIQDIIDTYGSWDFKNEKNYKRKAIFFIDEIEAHLHPKWESKVIPLLKKCFPNATFYIATHSPIIIASTEANESYELINENGTVRAKNLGDPKNWYLADIYSQAFHLNDFLDMKEKAKEEMLDKFKEFSGLVKEYLKTKNAETAEKARVLYADISNNLLDNDPRITTLNNLNRLIQ